MNYLEFMFSGFWHFLGCLIVITLILQTFALPFKLANRYMRHRNIIKHGYPPPHIDADGDFKVDPKNTK